MRRAPILAAALTLALLVLAGCGGGGGKKAYALTKAEYQAKVQEVAKQIGTSLGSVGSGTDNSPEAIENAQKAIRSFADELGKITPPEEIKSVHDDLVNGMRQFAGDLGGLEDRLKNAKDPGEALGALVGMKSFQTLLKAQQEFKAEGYDLDLNG